MASDSKEEPRDDWPSDPTSYEWKGTLAQTSSTWRVLAHCRKLKRDVIISIISWQTKHARPPDDASDDTLPADDDIDSFSSRVLAMQRLNHAHLLTPVHSFFFKAEVWTIFERRSGGDLGALLASHFPNGIADEPLVAALLLDAARGLAYLHRNEQCHRSLRPSAIFVDKERGIGLLSAFRHLKGVAFRRRNDAKVAKQQTLVSANREPWTDPLLALQHPGVSWYEGDVFSLGVTALHLVFGAPPTYGEAFSRALWLAVADRDSDGAALYAQIGPHAYQTPAAAAQSKLFAQFVADCTAPVAKRVKAAQLEQHAFFVKNARGGRVDDAETVRAKIGHLFQSTELRINAAFSAPTSFPNIKAAAQGAGLGLRAVAESNNQHDEFHEVEAAQHAHGSDQKAAEARASSGGDSDTDWNFRTSLRSKSATRIAVEFAEHEHEQEQEMKTEVKVEATEADQLQVELKTVKSEQKGRFTVQDSSRNPSFCVVSSGAESTEDHVNDTNDGNEDESKAAEQQKVIAKAKEEPAVQAIDWSVERCAAWLGELGDAYTMYQKTFTDNGIDGEMLAQLDDELLREMITSKLHRAKIISASKKLFTN